MFFLNPWAMVVGGAMVSAPILIHLINRMRFKRIRWAAMEFLLKSQKRNRRRLIIEQLILLMLRCLLVMLFGFLVARFVGEALGHNSSTSTTHIVLLDDTASMTDRAPKNQTSFAEVFDQAKEYVKDLAENAYKAPSAQTFMVVLLSNREKTFFNDRLTEESMSVLRKDLGNLKPTLRHVSPADAVATGKELLGKVKDSKRWLHLISDFREQDWSSRPANERLHKTLQEVAEMGTQVTLIDCSVPARAARGKSLEYHNNYAITELRPEKRIAPAGTQVPFVMEVENLGNESRDSFFIEVFVDGSEDLQVSRVYDTVPAPGQKMRYNFEVLFTGPGAGEKKSLHRVTARLKDADKQAGLLADNVRHTLVEIRQGPDPTDPDDPTAPDVPTLIVDGSGEEGDARAIRNALKSLKGIEAVKVKIRGVDELLRPDLAREYSTIYLLNVDRLGLEDKEKKEEKGPNKDGDKAKEKEREKEKARRPPTKLELLQQFVATGGNIVWFTGEKVDKAYYNDILFERSQGLFPVPVEKVASDKLSIDQIANLRKNSAPKIFILDRQHEITRGISGVDRRSTSDLIIPQYTEAKRRFEWTRDWSHESDVKDLIALASLTKVDDVARGTITKLLARIKAVESASPDAPKEEIDLQKKIGERLQTLVKNVREVTGNARDHEMYKVADAIDELLNDRGSNPGQKDNVSLQDYWSNPDNKDIRTELSDFRKDALFGSPLVLTRKYGKGNVVAFLTTSGPAWSGWSGGENAGAFSQLTFPMVVADLQKFLTRGSDGGQLVVGDVVRFELDPKVYKNEVVREIQIDEGKVEKIVGDAKPGFQKDSPIQGKEVAGKLLFEFPAAQKPGVHTYLLTPQAGGREARSVVFNMDTANESNLHRVSSEDVARNPTDASPGRGTIKWTTPAESSTALREKKNDVSESPWIYILFMLVLIVEQALAVHLSFHVKGNEPAPTKVKPAAANPVAMVEPI